MRTIAAMSAAMLLLALGGCGLGLPDVEPAPELPDDDDPGADDEAGDDDDAVEDPADDDDAIEDPADDDDAVGDDDDAVDPDPDEPSDDDDDPADDDDDGDPAESAFEACFAEISGPTDEPAPDYDAFGPTIADNCNGTNHQDISGIERVVFLGDSVTVGTLPSADPEFYRNRLALMLADEFGLEAPDAFWQGVNILSGEALVQESGDFASCAEWGARADDLMQDDTQVLDCLPESERHKVTLVVMTVGGNDLSNLTEGFMEGAPVSDLWTQTEEFMGLVRETVEWITAPGRFPNGVYVVTTNLYEFTDATGDVTSCPAAGLAGFGEAVTDPALAQMVVWAMEEFMSIAVDTNTDMLFLLESFCGHGFNYDDPAGRCYRGPEAEIWFDLTCIHPNPTGHEVIADMFYSVVME